MLFVAEGVFLFAMMTEIPGIGFIGAGTVARVLAAGLASRGYRVAAISSRSIASARRLAASLDACDAYSEHQAVADNADISLTPTIQTRNITSTVAVQSGETVVLGGLIRENNNSTGRGIPGLRDIPVLGWFFGASRDEITRTELVVLITPRAVRGAVEARAVTDEFREKMDSLKPNTSPHRGFGPWNYRTDELRDAFDSLGENAPDEAEPVEQSPNLPAPAPEPATVSEHNMRMERVLTPGRPSRPSAKEPEPVS